MDIAAPTLIDALRSRKIRVTRARRAVCEVLAATSTGHLTAAEVLDRVTQLVGATVDRATVYRTLDVLEEAGLVHHIHLEHGPAVYHLADRSRHHHFTCLECGRTIDLPDVEFAEVSERIEAAGEISSDGLRFSVTGRCRDCAAGTAGPPVYLRHRRS